MPRSLSRRLAALTFSAAGAFASFGESTSGRRVELTAPDGERLAATYFAAEHRGPGILLLHQCNRDQSSWDGLAPRLAAKGFHVLTLDYRGYGQSGGKRYTEMPFPEQTRITSEKWPGDVDTALAYLQSQKGVTADIIGAAGASCGVNQSIQLSRRHPEVKSLALLSGSTNREGRLHLKGHAGLPLLQAAADDDGGIVELMAWQDAISGNRSNRFLRYSVGGHGTDMFKARPELPDEVVAWFESTLLGRGTHKAAGARVEWGPTTRLLVMLDEPGGAARVAEHLAAERKKKDPSAAVLAPGFINRLGYEAMGAAETRAAVEIMTVNVETQPLSSNAWDSLADACLADGQPDRARQYSQKALELVDQDASESEESRALIRRSAQQKLDQLKTTAAPQ